MFQLHPALYFNGALFHHILTDEPFSPDMVSDWLPPNSPIITTPPLG